MNQKPHFSNGRFYNNPQDSILGRFKNMLKTIFVIILYRLKKQGRKQGILGSRAIVENWSVPHKPQLVSDELVITWLGHATFLIQIDGFNILTDPVFYEISRLAAGRLVPTPILPSDLPVIDAVLISHNHRDHLDEASIKELCKHQPNLCVPVGNKSWLTKRGFETVTEATWWDEIVISRNNRSIKFSFLPASHWTGRGIFDTNKSLWGSWMIQGVQHSVYFAGDTAYSDHFSAIAQKYPQIDVALMPIGPNEPRALMHDAHISAEESVEAFKILGAQHFIPMHWGTFMFGLDSFLAPINRLSAYWKSNEHVLGDKLLHVVKFGQATVFESQCAASRTETSKETTV